MASRGLVDVRNPGVNSGTACLMLAELGYPTEPFHRYYLQQFLLMKFLHRNFQANEEQLKMR